jgi:iron complex transport system permease protein
MKLRSILLLSLASLVLVALELMTGSVAISIKNIWLNLTGRGNPNDPAYTILWDSRVPRTLAAILAGSALAWSGMLMQTLFRNPLAGPSMLGISSGAALGVAVLVLGSGGMLQLGSMPGYLSIAAAAFLGAFLILGCVLLVANRFANESTLLIFGIMLTYFTSALIDAMQSRAGNDALRSYVSWGMGNFGECNYTELLLLAGGIIISIAISLRILPRLNILLLGEQYATTMGVDVKKTRIAIMLATGIMAGCATAFCGPVSFIGLAVPHLARWVTQTADHKKNLIATLWLGALLALACDWLSRMSALPLNTIASALGAPFVVMLVMKWKRFKTLI